MMNNYLYCCRITNFCEGIGVFSQAGLLTVNLAPDITTHPLQKKICAGENTSYSVSATGTGLNYSWQVSPEGSSTWFDLENNSIYSNVTTANLEITNAGAEMDQYQYRCKVTGTCSPDAYSNTVSLTVNTPPEIITHPENRVSCTGSNIILHVEAEGSSPLYYRWRKNGVLIPPGEWVEESGLYFAGISPSDAGIYDVFVKNMCSSPTGVESNDATVTVNIPPNINAQPEDKTLCEDSQPTVAFSTSVPGSGLSFQWEFSKDNEQTWTDLENVAPYSGVKTDELVIASTDDTLDQYYFRCKIIGVCEPPVTTESALLTIRTKPVFTSHPEPAEICTGEDVTFSVEVSGTEPFQYRWRKGDASIGSWTSSDEYTIYSATLDDIEKYSVMVKNICNEAGVESDKAQLTIHPLPFVSLGQDRHVCTGETTILDPGSGYSAFQWNTGENTQSIVVGIQGNYKVTVTDTNGCENSDNIYVFTDPLLPAINLGPDQKYCSGDEIVLDAGAGFDNYSWNDGSSGQSLSVYLSDKYYVTATKNSSVCISTDTVNITVAVPYDKEKICLITVDMLSGRNLIIWEKNRDAGIVAYRVYRQTSTAGDYELLETIPYESMSIYTDHEADPEVRQWVYKITAIDTCENESDIKVSPYHRPLFLDFYGADDGVNLRWEPYVVEGTEIEFLTYEIYRGSDSISLSYLDEISGDLRVYKDKDPKALQKKYFYRVAGVKSSPCYPSENKKADPHSYSLSMSNMEDNRFKKPPNHAPADIVLDNLSIDENQPFASLIGRLTAFDPDTADSHQFMLVPDTEDNEKFIISGDSLLSAESFDFEQVSSFTVVIRCIDNGTDNLSFDKTFTISINDVIETGFADVYIKGLKIYPNPFRNFTTIEFTNPDRENYRLVVTNISGKIVCMEEKMYDEKIEFSRRNIPSGIYFIELRGPKVYRGKMVIE
jgi:hypothetical protein